MYDSLEQLLHDICNCASIDVYNIVSRIESDNQELDMVERFVMLLSLNENVNYLNEIINSLNDYSLLIYRLEAVFITGECRLGEGFCLQSRQIFSAG